MTIDHVNYYTVLRVSKHAKEGEIRKAFREVEKAFESEGEMVLDSERWEQAERKLLTARQAMETLLDPDRRRKHDELIDRMGSKEQKDTPGERLFYFCFNCSQAFVSPPISQASVTDCPSCGAQNLLNPPVDKGASPAPPRGPPPRPRPGSPGQSPPEMVQPSSITRGFDPWPPMIKGESRDEPVTIDIEAEERPGKPKEAAPRVRPLIGQKPTAADLRSIYKEALKRALKDGVITQDEEYILEGLRSILGITQSEHESLSRSLGFTPGRKAGDTSRDERDDEPDVEFVADND